MLSLPNELLLDILRLCDNETIHQCSPVDRRLHQVVERYRLGRRHVHSLEIIDADADCQKRGEFFRIVLKLDCEQKRSCEFTFMRDRETKDVHYRGEPFSAPDAVREFVEGLNKEVHWKLGPYDNFLVRRMDISDPFREGFPILREILKRVSVHRLMVVCDTPTFLSRVFAMLQKHRTGIYDFRLECQSAKYEHLETLPSMLDFLGCQHFTLSSFEPFSGEQEHNFTNDFSDSKLASFDVSGSTTVPPNCLLVKAKFRNIEGIVELVKEWARGDREIVHYELIDHAPSEALTLENIESSLRDVRGLWLAHMLIGGEKALMLEKNTLPEGDEHQKYLYVTVRGWNKYSVILRSSGNLDLLPPSVDRVRPCTECSPSEKLVAERLAQNQMNHMHDVSSFYAFDF